MLELFVTKPIFQGNDEIHQLEVIYSVMGTPKEETWPGLTEMPWYELVKPKNEITPRFRESFTKWVAVSARGEVADEGRRWLSPAALDLAQGLLVFDPAKRLSAADALGSAYFGTEEPGMEKPAQ
jgi:CTD kinase subunit alpha